jgi:RNA polymerase sigma-70 factor (ECF subfamily)
VSQTETTFVRLYNEYYDDVHAFCLRRVGRDSADDAATEVFTTVWRRIDEIDDAMERAWLFSVARNVVLNQWRSNSRRRRLGERVGGLAVSPPDQPETVIVRREEDEAVIEVLNEMRHSDREILVLAAWDDLLQAAQQRLHRAKGRLAKRLRSVPDSEPSTADEGRDE